MLEDGEPGGVASRRVERVVSYEEAFKRELEEFAAAIAEGREPRTGGEDGLRDVALCRSIRRWRMPPEVHWSSQRPTIMDVANLSGVSKSTVSNVLRGAGRVSESTRGRVLESIEALGYRPNSLARDLVRRRSNTIGVVLGDLANTFYADLVKLLELRISDAAYTTIVCNTDGRLELERARVEMLLERAVSGVVMLQFGGDGSVLHELALARVPVVVISCWDERADCVAVDDRAGMAAAVEHLHGLEVTAASPTSPAISSRTAPAPPAMPAMSPDARARPGAGAAGRRQRGPARRG